MRIIKKKLIEIYRTYSRLVSHSSCLTAHKTVLFQGRTRVPNKRGRVYISENVTLNSCTWSNPLNINNSLVLCAFEGAEIILEKGCGISGSRIIASAEIKIGESSLVGAGCLICDSDMHEVPLLSQNAIQIAPIKIGQRVFIGANTTILKGVTIGDGTVIGAGSVVVHDIPENVLAAGNPAKVICSFSQVSKS